MNYWNQGKSQKTKYAKPWTFPALTSIATAEMTFSV